MECHSGEIERLEKKFDRRDPKTKGDLISIENCFDFGSSGGGAGVAIKGGLDNGSRLTLVSYTFSNSCDTVSIMDNFHFDCGNSVDNYS